MRVTMASVSKEFEDACKANVSEYLFSEPGKPRPCLILLTLTYRGQRHRFALPLRSNIPAASPKNHYHPLPPTHRTQRGKRAGIHYAKMFPVPLSEQREYDMRSQEDKNALKVIKRDYADIDKEARAFLDDHAKIRKQFPDVVTDIDAVLSKVMPLFS